MEKGQLQVWKSVVALSYLCFGLGMATRQFSNR
jgi:hypothetical protein